MTVEALATRVNNHYLAGTRLDSVRPTALHPVSTLPRPAAPIDPMRVIVISVELTAGDAVLHMLDDSTDLAVVSALGLAEVAVVVTDRLDDSTLLTLQTLAEYGQLRTALVVREFDGAETATFLRAGAVAIVRRSDVNRGGLRQLIRAVAAGQSMVPVDVLRALSRPGQPTSGPLVFGASGVSSPVPPSVQPTGMARVPVGAGALNDRETKVICLLADGSDTREVARKLCYSERTVKAIIQDITARYGLRNRSHVVAYALRQGLI